MMDIDSMINDCKTILSNTDKKDVSGIDSIDDVVKEDFVDVAERLSKSLNDLVLFGPDLSNEIKDELCSYLPITDNNNRVSIKRIMRLMELLKEQNVQTSKAIKLPIG